MADLHMFSVDNIVAMLSNSTSSNGSRIPPSSASHDSSYNLNLTSDCLSDSGAWQQFEHNPHIPFLPPFPCVGSPSPTTLQQLSYAFNDEMAQAANLRELIGRLGNSDVSNGVTSLASNSKERAFRIGEQNSWRALDRSKNAAFGLDLPKESSFLAASCCLASVSSNLAVDGHPKAAPSFCNSRFSELGEETVGASDKAEAMGMGIKHAKASNSLTLDPESGVSPMQPVYAGEEECQSDGSPKNSSSQAHAVVQHFYTCTKGAAAAGRKRKSAEDKTIPCLATAKSNEPKKEIKTEDTIIKGQRSSESRKEVEEMKKAESHSSANSGDSGGENLKESSKPPQPPKQDFIHVRARRGQATDSHSLAERVRREKISDRMKFLQDLVPGCSKVSGKAVMLDEIINYVQSLQRQVELLSMKLAAVNPRLDFCFDPKEVLQEYISPPAFNFNQELISHFPFLGPAQAKLNQLGVRSMGGFDSKSQSRSSPTMLDGRIFRDVNSQFGADFSRTASLACPTFKDQLCVQHPNSGI